MKKETVRILISILLIILVILALGFYFYSFNERTKIENKTKDSSDYKNIFDDLEDIGGDVDLGAEYKILYGKNNNVITPNVESTDCKDFTSNEYLGGGIVKRDGSDNENLELKQYPTSYPHSKYYNNFYYISAVESPMSEVMGTVMLDRDYDDQSLYSTNFISQESKQLVASTENKFPGDLITSPDNRYIIYVMTDKTEEKFSGKKFDPEAQDSDLVIYDNLTGKENKVLTGEYNRQLFDNFFHFSKTENSIFTIRRAKDTYEFVKVDMDTGEVSNFDQTFPGFDWTKIKWAQFFTGEYNGFPAHFYLSPDESKLLAYENISGEATVDSCVPDISHNIWSFNINDNTIEKYDEGSGAVVKLSWRNDSKEFVFATISKEGSYPEYLDSAITRMSRSGENNGVLIEERGSKITNLNYSPDGKEIVYDVYNTDFASYIKTVNPISKNVEEIVSTYDIENKINQEKPVTLFFTDWVMVE